ncbi:MAG: hypothetical protein K6F09_07760 [Clostridiales bacterium]|nr:hypothetical protein [Clostridiales bacterium]
MSFADDLRKKADNAPKEEQDAEIEYMKEIYISLKRGVVGCFLRKCEEEASRGGTSYILYLDFIQLIGIIHEQERIYVKDSDFDYVKHVLKTNKEDFKTYIIGELEKNALKDIKVTIKASDMIVFGGYYIKIGVSW